MTLLTLVAARTPHVLESGLFHRHEHTYYLPSVLRHVSHAMGSLGNNIRSGRSGRSSLQIDNGLDEEIQLES